MTKLRQRLWYICTYINSLHVGLAERLKRHSTNNICRFYPFELKVYRMVEPGRGAGGGGVEETRSGTEKRCSHNLQSGHPAWWSADNYSIFPIVNILEARIEASRQRKSEMLKKLKKKSYHASLFFLHIVFVFRYWNCGGNRVRS